jgi:putative oxidoreductase
MKPLFLIGRVVLGGFFVYNGINHLRNRRGLAQYAGSKQVPMPDTAVTVSGLMLLAGGSSILLGLQPKYGAALIIAFLAGVSPTMHDFWRAEDPNQKMNDMVHLMKNVALAGSALALMGVEEPWPLSLHYPKQSRLERVADRAKKLLA